MSPDGVSSLTINLQYQPCSKAAATGSVIVYGPPLNMNTLPESLCNTSYAALISTIFNSELLASGVWAIAAPTGAAIMM